MLCTAVIRPSLLQEALLCFGLSSRYPEKQHSAGNGAHLPSFPKNEAICRGHKSQPAAREELSGSLCVCALGYVVSVGYISALMKTPLQAILLLTPQLLGCSGWRPLQGLRKIMFLRERQ